MRDMTAVAQATGRQIKLITQANREHSVTSASILTALTDIRRITDTNVRGVREAKAGTEDLRRCAADLDALMGNGSARTQVNGRGPGGVRRDAAGA
jgi:methyl-accepting chemotaxis protein